MLRKLLLLGSSIIALALALVSPALAVTRTYYIAADEVIWNYAPSGHDLITGKPLPPTGKYDIGPRYLKAVYREYTDASFKHLKPRPAGFSHMGILGPVIRAEVGDTIVVVFRNNARFPFGIHAHGVLYDKNSEGAPYQDGRPKSEKRGDAVPKGGTFTYTWQVPERAGPGPSDPSSIVWMYHSHTDEVRDVNTGLFGPIIISAKGTTKPDGTPKDVDREVFTAFAELEEDQSLYLKYNIATFAPYPKTLDQINGQVLGNIQKYTMNGFVFGNMPMVVLKKGERVRWYVMATMSDFDFHVPHWHGNTLLMNNMRTDAPMLGVMGMEVLDMVPDNPGIWLYHCHVNVHLQLGMVARYQVIP
jgi:FtsP/CotA-like multicopper oxidase with cupredoxin domain